MLFIRRVEILGGEQLRFFCYNMFACETIGKILTIQDIINYIYQKLNLL